MTERLREPELAAEYDRSVIGRKRIHMRQLIRDAVERGDLRPDTDIDLLAETAPALVWHHVLNNQPVGPDLAARIVDQIIPQA
jgi:predicted ATPase